jgi:radical SAM superfamily enzyme YgiQ (UPF0313 family)
MIVSIRNRRDAAIWRCVRRVFDQGADPREAIEELLTEWQDVAADAWLSGEAERELVERRARVLEVLRETAPSPAGGNDGLLAA